MEPFRWVEPRTLWFLGLLAGVALGTGCRSTSDSGQSRVSDAISAPTAGDDALYIYRTSEKVCIQQCPAVEWTKISEDLAQRRIDRAQAIVMFRQVCVGFKSLSDTDFRGFFNEQSAFSRAVSTPGRVLKVNRDHPDLEQLLELAGEEGCQQDDSIIDIGGDYLPPPNSHRYPRIERGWYQAGDLNWGGCILDLNPTQDETGKLRTVRAETSCFDDSNNCRSRTFNGTCRVLDSSSGQVLCRDPSYPELEFTLDRIQQGTQSELKMLGQPVSKRDGPPVVAQTYAFCRWEEVGINPNASNYGSRSPRNEVVSDEAACSRKCTDSLSNNIIQNQGCRVERTWCRYR